MPFLRPNALRYASRMHHLPVGIVSRIPPPSFQHQRPKHTSPTGGSEAPDATSTSAVPPVTNTSSVMSSLLDSARAVAAETSSILSQARESARTHKRAVWGVAGGAVLLAAVYFLSGDDGSDDEMLGRPNPADIAVLSRLPTAKLISGWIVYAFCSSPTLIDWSEPLFRTMRRIPVVSFFVDDFARRTFFRQASLFFGEESAAAAEKTVWTPLRREHVGILTAYNIEAETYDSLNSPETISECVEGTLDAIEAVGSFGVTNSTAADVANGDTRCWVRTKVSGLVPDPKTMIRASEYIVSHRKGAVCYPGVPEDGDFARLMDTEQGMSDRLSPEDMKSLHELYEYLRLFVARGQKYGVRIIMDAEQSWYQPVVDVMTEGLMREFNTSVNGPAVVCASFQAYLRRNKDLIESQMQRAKEGGYKLIFKQVRGAYMPYERARWAQQGRPGPSPVWNTKVETDQSYDAGIRAALQAIQERQVDDDAADVAVIFATHNEVSVDNTINYLASMSLAERQADGSLLVNDFTANRVAFAQIYGMKDNLTNRIAATIKTSNSLPVVCKSATYGTLEHALPNLSRRAAENKTVMEGRGGAVAERKRLARELCRRYIPFYHSER